MRKDRLFDLLIQIKEWHEETFPDATAGDQLLKLEEELEEVEQAKNSSEVIKEFADVLIVCAGLMRWNKAIPNLMRKHFVSKFNNFDIDYQEEILQALQAKFQRNKSRIWTRLPDGRYKHINQEEED